MAFKIPIKNRYLLSGILGLAAFGLVLFGGFILQRPFAEWEEKTLDYRFRLRNSIPLSPAIINIGIEDGSLEKIGVWPWDRSIHARMVKLLHTLNVALINFDIFFLAHSREPGDSQLITAVQEAGNVILSAPFELRDHPCFTPREYEAFSKKFPRAEDIITVLKTQKGENICVDFNQLSNEQWNALGEEAGLELLSHAEFAFTGEGDREKLEVLLRKFRYPFTIRQQETVWYANRASLPIKELTEAASGFGHVTASPDSDGVFRRVPLIIRVKDQLFPHMALTAILRYLQVKPEDVTIVPGEHILLHNARFPETTTPKDLKIPVDDRLQMRINFPPAWKAHAFADVLEAENDPEAAGVWKKELETLGLSRDKWIDSFDRYGNLGAVEIATNIEEAEQDGKLSSGSIIAMFAMAGGGHTPSMVGRWL